MPPPPPSPPAIDPAPTSHEPHAWTMGSWLAIVVLCWYPIIWSICLLGLHRARLLFSSSSRPSPNTPDEELPGVTVIRPLAGLDSNLFNNLASSFEQHYPRDRFEIILSVKDEADQAVGVARAVRERYPDVQCTIVVGDEEAGVNPKVNNLVRPYALAKHDIVWVLDSQCSLAPSALRSAVSEMLSPPCAPPPSLLRKPRSRVGLVHHVPLATHSLPTMGSQLERCFLSSTHAKMYLAINCLEVDSCVMGKSNLWRRSDLAIVPDAFFDVGEHGTAGEEGAIGSRAFASEGRSDATDPTYLGPSRPLARFSIYLAEDNMLALSLFRPPLSLQHTLASHHVVRTNVGDIRTVGDYMRRRMRWIRVRKRMVLGATLVEPLTESGLVGALLCWAAWTLVLPRYVLGRSTAGLVSLDGLLLLAIATAHFFAWHAVDTAVMTALRGGVPLSGRDLTSYRLAWVGREVLALPVWAWAMAGNTVVWRGHRYRILPNGRAAHAPSKSSGASNSLFAKEDGYERVPDRDD